VPWFWRVGGERESVERERKVSEKVDFYRILFGLTFASTMVWYWEED